MNKLFLFLCLLCSCFGQALPTDLPYPPVPSATSSPSHKAAYAFGDYWYKDAQKNRSDLILARQQVAVLAAQLAAASQPTSGSVVLSAEMKARFDRIDEISQAITAKLNSAGANVEKLIARIKPVENLRIKAGSEPNTIQLDWDYDIEPSKLSGFRVYAGTVEEGGVGINGIVGSPLAGQRSWVSPKLDAGHWMFTVRAWHEAYALADESGAADPVGLKIAAP